MYLSVIIPAYNEEKRIGATLLAVHQYLSRQSYQYEILVVSDGSKDNTSTVVNSLKSQVAKLVLLDNKENHGKGWVVKQGMLAAQGDYRLFMDADNSTTVDQVEHFLPLFSQGYDVVVGSRRTAGAKIEVKQNLFRDFLGGAFRFLVHILAPVGVTDSQAGFKAFSRRAAEAVFPQQTIFRWAFDVEILTIAKKLGLKIKEAPINWVNDEQSHVKFGGMVKMFFEVLQVRINLLSGIYG